MAQERPARRPTVADVARRAGVSVATAGRVLGGYGNVSADRRAGVEAAAAELGYAPNSVARSMRSGGSRSIGFVAVDIANPFFALAMRGVADVAHEEGYETIVLNTDDDLDLERSAVRVLLEKQVEGIVVSPTSVTEVEHLRTAQHRGVPVVLLDRHSPVLQADSVVIDNQQAAADAVGHLLSAGHRRIGVLVSIDAAERPELVEVAGRFEVRGPARPSVERLRGYIRTVQEHGLRVRPELVRLTPLSDRLHAEQSVADLFAGPAAPTALFATDNVATQTAYATARRLDRSIPDQLSLVGFDDADWTVLVSPAVTVLAQSPRQMGRAAAQRLFARINGDERSPTMTVVPTELMVRDSVAKPARRR
jgi:LacI family transcriptional regulator